MSDQTTAKVLLYSDDRTVREQVRLTLGSRLADDLPEIEVIEVATQPVVLQVMDAGGIDLVILDGEAVPAGGFGLAHQLKDEIADCPPVLLLVARVADAWLATWSRAEGVSSYPVDPVRLPALATDLLRARLAVKAE
ncbi:MAG: response regulator [Propionicimonas sp.]|uniref:response regulator n=1 Tax=Propionicimonas sp. TaxID=1955623 RepID=UPI002B1F46BB|nr:response regulator [Propionicimonas sp.]MEA4945539.1 response regulator [Propionicimonas sp.]MEA5052427.1 response regulator [Propionicimonas sp.]MEA5116603.1 response regulator [Propionicimonas sp.]